MRVVYTEMHCAAAETTGEMKRRAVCVGGTFLGVPHAARQPLDVFDRIWDLQGVHARGGWGWGTFLLIRERLHEACFKSAVKQKWMWSKY